jgi:sugar phosphate isomerase/epimerase
MTLAMSTEVSRHTGIAGALALARQLGVTAVELIPSMFGGDHGKGPSLPDAAEVAALRAMLDTHGLRAVAANASFMPAYDRWSEEDQFVPAPFRTMIARATPEEYVRYLLWLTRAASVLGIDTIVCASLVFTAATKAESLDGFVQGMVPVLAAAQDHGVTIALEHEAMCPLIRFEPGLQSVLAAIDHPSFGLAIDTSNLFAAGIDPYPYAYERWKSRIKHVHLRGARPARASDPAEVRWFERMTALGDSKHSAFTTLRDGAVDVAGLLARLDRDGYRGHITMQPLVRGALVAELPRMLEDDFAFIAGHRRSATPPR